MRGGQSAPGFYHRADAVEHFAGGRRQQVDFEFHGQHFGLGRHQRKRRVAARAVQRAGDDAGVQKTVLLGEVAAVGEMQFHFAGRDARQRHAERAHHALRGETAFYALAVVFCAGCESVRHRPIVARPPGEIRGEIRRRKGLQNPV